MFAISIFCALTYNVHLILSKQFQKSLTKQGLKLKLSTKVLSAEKDGKVIVTTKVAKDGKQETVSIYCILVATCMRV
jgi:dihydrolipoamide dehydrogenase